MREIKFRIERNGKLWIVETIEPKRKDHKGIYKTQGYIMRLVTEHPFADKRRYVREHRLIMEHHLGRFLEPTEIIHHKDQNRENNSLSNLELQGSQEIHIKDNSHLRGKRNNHGQFIANEPIFSELKYRLYNKNTKATKIYTLATLIGTTFRRGQFEFRGRWTGLKDKNGKEIYEGDIVEQRFVGDKDSLLIIVKDIRKDYSLLHPGSSKENKVIGNIHENGELLKDGRERKA